MVSGCDNKPQVRSRQLEGLAAADGAGAQCVLSVPYPRVLGAPCHSRTPTSTYLSPAAGTCPQLPAWRSAKCLPSVTMCHVLSFSVMSDSLRPHSQ